MAFHPYPQVIQTVFSRYWFGPPHGFTRASTCSWIDHPVSGLIRTTCALFRLAFASAPLSLNLAIQINSLTHYAKGTWSLPKQLPQLVSTRFQILFHSPPGVLFAFPSRYLFTIGRRLVCSLGRWSSQIPTGFHVSRGTQVPSRLLPVSGTGLSPSLVKLSSSLPLPSSVLLTALQPRSNESERFRLFPFRSPLLRESRLISLPSGTEMFHFPEFASRDYVFIS